MVSAGLTNPSTTRLLADRLAQAETAELEARGIEVFELRDHAHALTDNLLTGFPSPALEAVINTIVSPDVRGSDPFDPASYLGEGRSFGHLLGGLADE